MDNRSKRVRGSRRPGSPPAGTQSVRRALELLRQLGKCPTQMSLGELAERTRLHPSTVSRLLAALELFDLAVQDPQTEQFSLGPACVQLGHAFLGRTRVAEVAEPLMFALSRELNLQSHLAVLQAGRLVHIKHTDPEGYAPIYSEWQRYMPGVLHAQALGKVLLAYVPQEQIETLLEGLTLEKFTPRTIDRRRKLLAELNRVRRQGYAVDNGELLPHVRCVGVPIHDHVNQVVAALSLSGTSQTIPRRRIRLLAARLQETAGAISHRLGAC